MSRQTVAFRAGHGDARNKAGRSRGNEQVYRYKERNDLSAHAQSGLPENLKKLINCGRDGLCTFIEASIQWAERIMRKIEAGMLESQLAATVTYARARKHQPVEIETLNTLCPSCGYSIPPGERERIDSLVFRAPDAKQNCTE
jgi:hypothetical protein